MRNPGPRVGAGHQHGRLLAARIPLQAAPPASPEAPHLAKGTRALPAHRTGTGAAPAGGRPDQRAPEFNHSSAAARPDRPIRALPA
jgi:hypothetical protein